MVYTEKMIKAVIFDCFGVLTGTREYVPNDALFAYIRDSLKPQVKIGMLSNAADNHLDTLFEPWQVALFDDVVLSYQTGMVKPEPEIFQHAATRLDALPEECIFVDDIERYCTAAGDLGMQTIIHSDTKETIAKIEELLHA